MRKIAILIVSGKVQAIEFKPKKGDNLWKNSVKYKNCSKIHYHGKEWHGNMMHIISEYFKCKGFKIATEPTLHYGRADLGVYSDNPLFIEIGTVSLFKLWCNLSAMENTTLLLAPSEQCLIEFKT